MLLGVDLPNGIGITYLVDAEGRRIGKKVNGDLTKGWLYAGGLSPVAELDGSGAILSTFVYATRGNVPDFMLRGGTAYRIFTDPLGSVRLVIDSTTGAIAQRIDYDAFGRITYDSSPGFQPFGFAGGLYDYQTGLVRFGAEKVPGSFQTSLKACSKRYFGIKLQPSNFSRERHGPRMAAANERDA